MTVSVTNETTQTFDFSFEEIGTLVVDAVLDEEAFPFEVSVDITLVGLQEIHELNLTQRGVDRPTDVLSFPMVEYPAPGDFDSVEENDDNFDPDTGEVVLGDIVICLDKVKQQAEEYGHSLKREYAFLVCHSMLHLLGYDHETPEEETVMYGKQEEILDKLGIRRDTGGKRNEDK